MKSILAVYLDFKLPKFNPALMKYRHLIPPLFFRQSMSILLLFVGLTLHAQVKYSDQVDDTQLRSSINEFIKFAQPLIESSLSFTEDFSEEEMKEVLLTKINVTSAINMAIFHDLPIYSLLDTWILLYQIEGCASDNPVFKEAIGELILRISEIFRYMAELLPFSKSQEFVQQYALSHPISCSYVHRESPLGKIEYFLNTDKKGVISKINDVADQLDFLNFKMNYWMEYLPKQFRWQMQLLSYELLTQKYEGELSPVDLMVSSNELFNKTSVFIDKTPFMLDTFNLEWNATIEKQMIAINTMMANERRAFLAGLSTERATAIDSLINHFNSWKALIENAQANGLNDIDELSNKFINSTSLEMKRLLDRITILVVLFCITILSSVLILRWKRS